MNENAMPLIAKLIEQTKCQNLSWYPYDSLNHELKPQKTEFFSNSSFAYSSIPFNKTGYYCTANNTIFYLMEYSSFGSNHVRLHAQTKSSAHSKLYASTEDDNVAIVSELKRLYNLVESMEDPVDESIREFIGL